MAGFMNRARAEQHFTTSRLIARSINGAGECRRAAAEAAATGKPVGFYGPEGHKDAARRYLDDARTRRLHKAAYFVKGGHTLGFIYPAQPQLFNILAGKPQLGGHDWKDGFVAYDPADLKPATRADFEYFRVCSKGHLDR